MKSMLRSAPQGKNAEKSKLPYDICRYSFSPENLEISRKVLIFAVETMNEYGQTGI
jgi:hypothetical protein